MTSVPATANPLEQLPTSSWTDISTGPARLTIFNASGRGVQLVWLNYEGGDVVYNVLGNGQEAVQGASLSLGAVEGTGAGANLSWQCLCIWIWGSAMAWGGWVAYRQHR